MNYYLPPEQYKHASNYDEFEKVQVDLLYGNYARRASDVRYNLQFNLGVTKPLNMQKKIYRVMLEYSAENWMFIDKNRPMILLIDNERFELKSAREEVSRKVRTLGTVTESCSYEIDKEMLFKIFRAKSVKFKIYGDNIADGFLSAKNIENLKRFIQETL